MKIKAHIMPVLMLGLLLSLASLPAANAQDTQEQQRVIIPPKIKALLTEGMESRQARTEIPFSFSKFLFLPTATENMHAIFFFNIRNSDLGFAAPAAPEKKEEEVSAFQTAAPQMQARCHTFLQFTQLDGEFTKDVYIPLNLQAEGEGFDPEKVETYTTGYPLPPGQWLLSMAISAEGSEKIGTQYYEFTLPRGADFTDSLGMTPVFFVDKYDRMPAVETHAEIHKKYFTFSVLQIEANVDHVFAPGGTIEPWFFIFGAQTNAEGLNDIEVNYQVLKDEEVAIRYAPATYDRPLVSQPLFLKKTVLIKTTKEGETTERKEERDLEPGSYTFTIEIKDKLSGKTLAESINFEVK